MTSDRQPPGGHLQSGGAGCSRTRDALALRLSRLLLLLLLASCGQAGTSAVQQPSAVPAAPAPTAEEAAPTSPPAPTASPVAQEGTFQNPVLRQDFPDPGILAVDGVYYAFATNASGRNIQAARSEDLVDWELLPDALPALPAWARLGGSFVWAPEVIAVGESYVMYFTARSKEADRQCIGVAVAERPEGRYRPVGDAPLVCQVEEGGSIDPSPFRDGEQLYLYWKNDGNCCSQPTYLYAQPLAPDGLTLTGEPARLVRNDVRWEGSVVEAPTMLRREESYYLFFSGNSYAGLDYAVGYALCESPLGPCEDAPENPILESKLDEPPLVVGPGHQTIVEVDGETWLVYHAWEVLNSGARGSRRFVWLDRITWDGGTPDVAGPTVGPQPAPEAGAEEAGAG
jgi:beta-xylosidase